MTTPETPEAVENAALAALTGAPPAAAVAELVSDEDLCTDRHGLSRRFGFAASVGDITFEVTWRGDDYSGVVQLVPPRPFGVTVFVADPGPRALRDVTASDNDALEVGSLPPGPCMLLVSSDGASAQTEWVTLLRPDGSP